MTSDITSLRNEFGETIKTVRQAIDDLRLFVDRNDSEIRDQLGEVKLISTELDSVVYGNARQGSPGIIKRVETLEKLVEEIELARRERQATLNGIKIGLTLTGAASVGTLVTVLTQLLGG